MFNVCPGCGEYTDAKDVTSSPVKAVCPSCRHEHGFSALQLFVITGESGSGKTTAALKLAARTMDYVVLDQDILWNDAFSDGDFKAFRNTWLRLIKNIHQSGKSVVLFGTTVPEQYESCIERRYLANVHYLALVCDSHELEPRLKARPPGEIRERLKTC